MNTVGAPTVFTDRLGLSPSDCGVLGWRCIDGRELLILVLDAIALGAGIWALATLSLPAFAVATLANVTASYISTLTGGALNEGVSYEEFYSTGVSVGGGLGANLLNQVLGPSGPRATLRTNVIGDLLVLVYDYGRFTED